MVMMPWLLKHGTKQLTHLARRIHDSKSDRFDRLIKYREPQRTRDSAADPKGNNEQQQTSLDRIGPHNDATDFNGIRR